MLNMESSSAVIKRHTGQQLLDPEMEPGEPKSSTKVVARTTQTKYRMSSRKPPATCPHGHMVKQNGTVVGLGGTILVATKAMAVTPMKVTTEALPTSLPVS